MNDCLLQRWFKFYLQAHNIQIRVYSTFNTGGPLCASPSTSDTAIQHASRSVTHTLQLLLSAASKLVDDKLETLTTSLARTFKNRCWFWQSSLEYTEAD